MKVCHQFADAGVDLIVGSHPHVLRPMEEYNGVDIIYSLPDLLMIILFSWMSAMTSS